MDVLKYFHEEPAVLAALAGPAAPTADGLAPLDVLFGPAAGSRLFRGYLAGTHLPDTPGDAPRVGLTALADAALYTRPLLDLFGGAAWTRLAPDGAAEPVDAEVALADLAGSVALAVADVPLPASRFARLGSDRAEAARALVALLADARAVLFPEPAHDGHDLALFARTPLREPFVAALRRHPAPGARRFVLPYARARGEHHFYFEQWQLGALPPHVEEV